MQKQQTKSLLLFVRIQMCTEKMEENWVLLMKTKK